jgi:hypothetical protein
MAINYPFRHSTVSELTLLSIQKWVSKCNHVIPQIVDRPDRRPPCLQADAKRAEKRKWHLLQTQKDDLATQRDELQVRSQTHINRSGLTIVGFNSPCSTRLTEPHLPDLS